MPRSSSSCTKEDPFFKLKCLDCHARLGATISFLLNMTNRNPRPPAAPAARRAKVGASVRHVMNFLFGRWRMAIRPVQQRAGQVRAQVQLG